ncbi:uncharacterized protein LOC110979958 isoform X2 [Acanthaster planci]|uniref:RING-type E3 ubiquitin transferase n=1 Tax=Acanthaster planci TaxID=133434 RepID=A0A8B7YJX2_ACAPL|nr:uncharacterized protein LOC110979958 isoform X2 [Acanthaster planci]
MADVAKRRSIFICNIPPASSVEALEGFLRQELESCGQDRGQLVQIIFPVSSSSPHQALATFQDEKAMVALMRKRLHFDGEHLVTHPFLSHVFTSVMATINPDITELFPFNSQGFCRLLEKRSGVECRKMEAADSCGLRHPSQTQLLDQQYVLAGSWYQLQNARKFLQEWMVDETNRAQLNDKALRKNDERAADVPLPSFIGGSKESPEEETRSSSCEHGDHDRTGLQEKYASGPNMEGLDTTDASEGSEDERKPKLRGRKVAASFEELSDHNSPGADCEGIDSTDRHHSPPSNDEMPLDNSSSRGSLHHQEPPESSHPTSKTTEDDRDSFTLPPKDQGISSDPLVEGTAKGSTSSLASDRDSGRPDDDWRSLITPNSFGPTAVASVSSERSEDRITVGSSLDYLKHVRVPRTPLASLESELHGQESSETAALRIGSAVSKKDEETLSPRDDLHTNSTEHLQSSSTVTEDRVMDGDDDEIVEGIGSLPVDPGVFSYILLKESDPIRDIEERFGVKFSMHATRETNDSDAESALLKITPTTETTDMAQAHDGFINFYSVIFSTLHHRAITTTDKAFDSETLMKTVDMIHKLYETVLVTVTNHKVLIYGPSEVDVRLAKMLILDSLKETPVDPSGQQGPSGFRRHDRDYSSAMRSADLACAQRTSEVSPDENSPEGDGQGGYSVARREHSGSDNIDGILETQTQARENEPEFTIREGLNLSSSDLEEDSSPQMPAVGNGLKQTYPSGRLTGARARFEDDAADYQQVGGPRILNPSTASEAEPVVSPEMTDSRAESTRAAREITRSAGEVTVEQDRRSFSQKEDSMANVIPVDPGVFAFIHAQKHTILCDIEQNYGVKFKVKGDPDSDVYMVEVESVTADSETAAQQGREAFANFYQEVFVGLEHRAISLGDFEALSTDCLAGIIEEMEHSFSDLLFRVADNKVLIYGQGWQNVDLAKDMMCRRLRGCPMLSPEVQQHGDDTDLESLSSDSMVNRLYHLRYSSFAPESPDADKMRALLHNGDTPVVNGPGDTGGMMLNSQEHLSRENGQGHLPSQHPSTSVVEQKYTEQKEQPMIQNEYSRLQDGRLIFKLSSGIRVRVYCHDITMIRVDAIVNAANETLSNYAGVAGAIRRVAGEVMQADCNSYIAKHGLLYPAKVIHTGAGNLPCKFVLHAVGPMWEDYPNKQQCRQTLRATVVKCLRTADEKLQVSTLAMPFISSGIFGVPFEFCVEEICKALLDVNRRRVASPHCVLQEVHIVDLDSVTIQQAQDIMIKMLSQEASAGSGVAQGMKEVGVRETLLESGASGSGGYERKRDIPVGNEDGATKSQSSRKQRGASARLSESQQGSSSSSGEDVHAPHKNLKYAQMEDYSLPASRPAIVRSASLPYLPRDDDDDDPRRTHWAYRTSGPNASQGRELKSQERSSHGRKSDLPRERVREKALRAKTAPAVSHTETRQEKQVIELLDAFSKAPPSPELSRKTERELNRLLSEQERGAREKQQRPIRRTQSLDRSRPRQKCFVCSSTWNLLKRKSCEHFICEDCKSARLDVGRCKECSKSKIGKEAEKRCDHCLCSTKHLLVNCKGCENAICIKCVAKGLDTCQNCIERIHSSVSEGHAEKKPPKVRRPITAARTSLMDTKNDYRIKTSIKGAASTRRKPMLGLNQPVDIVAYSYSNPAGMNGLAVAHSSHSTNSAFTKEFVAEEAPHEEILRRLSREQEARHPIFPKDTVSSRSSVTESLLTNHRQSKKHASKTDDLEVIGQSSASISRQQEPICVICMDKIKDPKSLPCKHTFCTPCIEKQFQFKPICPVCGACYGQLRGDQPEGSMNCRTVSTDLPGYPDCGTIIVTYTFLDGIQDEQHPNPGQRYHGTQRQAYLPNNRHGQEVLTLLKRAFDARLLFTVGQSVTTGLANRVVWNDIHHKTRQTGGPERHGYPDPTYLQRVRAELEAKGIK